MNEKLLNKKLLQNAEIKKFEASCGILWLDSGGIIRLDSGGMPLEGTIPCRILVVYNCIDIISGTQAQAIILSEEEI